MEHSPAYSMQYIVVKIFVKDFIWGDLDRLEIYTKAFTEGPKPNWVCWVLQHKGLSLSYSATLTYFHNQVQ